jgi:hypothetical protein
MAREYINGHSVLSYEYGSRAKYWGALSGYIIERYGNNSFTEHKVVENILLDCFDFLASEFNTLVQKQTKFKFFRYVFWLHEESIKIYYETLKGFKINSENITENDFSIYRRILKLILEQGCEIDLESSKFPTQGELFEMDNIIQDLIYIGTWIYGFADMIAFQKMINNCHVISFDEESLIEIDWQKHYGAAYNFLFPRLGQNYSGGTYDDKATQELVDQVSKSFGIDYKTAVGLIFEIKKHHNPEDPDLQTIEPYVLPLNLVAIFKLDILLANQFYDGLSLKRTNKLSIIDAILKPYSTDRYLFRPILVYNIDGEERALIGKEKFAESMLVLSTNALHWNAMLSDWKSNKCIQRFMSKKADEHDRILEDKIEKILSDNELIYHRNLKSLKTKSGQNIRIDTQECGEIDFLIISKKLKTVFVAEVKYNRARYEGIGYRNDFSNFTRDYEPKLERKKNWAKDNLLRIEDHFNCNDHSIELKDYSVQGIFLINTPTFYMFVGNFWAITLSDLSEFFNGYSPYPILKIETKDGSIQSVNHPYFDLIKSS